MNDDTIWTTIDYAGLINEIEQLQQEYKRISFNNLLKSSNSQIFLAISDILHSKLPWQLFFHIEQKSIIIPQCKCGNELGWHPDLRSYRLYCSKSCSAIFNVSKRKLTNMAAFGKEWHSQTDEWKDKVSETSLSKFGVNHYSKTDDWRDRSRDTNIKRYGVERPAQCDSILTKMKNTNLERYGANFAVENKDILAKIKNTNIERYGVKTPFENSEVQDKVKQSSIEKYGGISPLKNKKIKFKAVQTTRARYYSEDTLSKLEDSEWLRIANESGKSIGEIAKEIGVSSSNLCKIYHKQSVSILRHPASELERRIASFYTNIPLLKNDRSIIPPKELDIVFPNNNLAIEINGCYYHSEKFGKSKEYHLQKTTQCNSIGIELLQFWDTEINNQLPKVLNFINSKLGICDRLYARKTKLRLISNVEKRDFINDNHLQNDVGSSINLGLFDINDNLVMAATFGKPRFTKADNTTELLRLCSLSGITVVGGASKLIKYFVNQYMVDGDILLSYCNRRYSAGKVYEKTGFTLSSISPPGFFYIDSAGKYAGSRYQWQKHLLKDKLENYDPSITAFQNMKNNGFEKVWDCGQLVYTLKKLVL